MKKYLFVYAAITTAIIVFGGKILIDERQRLDGNNRSLMQSVESYRTSALESAATVQALRLKVGEYEELRAADAAKIRELGVKLRRVESASKSVVATEVAIKTPIRDTVIVRDTVERVDTVRLFRWQDSWVSVDGTIYADSVECKVRSVDTLHQVVHRVPRRFLFFRFGTKALRQEIVTTNPHSQIVYTEYIKIER